MSVRPQKNANELIHVEIVKLSITYDSLLFGGLFANCYFCQNNRQTDGFSRIDMDRCETVMN